MTIQYPGLLLLVGLFVIKEGFQLIAGLLILRKGKILKGALMTGKISTTVLFISLILMVLLPDMDIQTVKILTIVDCAVLLIAFLDYARIYVTHSSMIQDMEKSDNNT